MKRHLLFLCFIHYIFSMLAGEVLESVRLLSVSHGELDYFFLILRANQEFTVLMSCVNTAYLIGHDSSTSTRGEI